MSRKGFQQLKSDDDWDDDSRESHLVTVHKKWTKQRCCFFVILPLTVIIVLVLVAVVTGVAVHFAQSGRKGGTFTGPLIR